MFKQKIRASFIHLAISAFVITILLGLIISLWYPQPFFEISGLKHILIMLIGIDVVLGPLLTFIVFKSGKKSLKFDLATIASVQIAALCYGVVSIYEAHPLYIVYNDHKFIPVNANEVSPSQTSHDELKKSKLSGPTLVYAQPPSDPSKGLQLEVETILGKSSIETHPEYYEPFEKHAQTVLEDGLDPEKLFVSSPNKSKLKAFIDKHGKAAGDYAFLGLRGKEKDVLWAFDKETGKPVGILDIDPWHVSAQVAATK